MPTPKITSEKQAAKLSEKMLQIELAARERETAAAATAAGLPAIDLTHFPIAPETLALVPRDLATRLKVICFLNLNDEIRLGAVEPANAEVGELLYQLSERHRAHGALYRISEHSFAVASKLYDALPTIRPVSKGVTITAAEIEKFSAAVKDFSKLAAVLPQAPVTDIVTMIVAAALEARSSDVHIEAEEKTIIIRFRIDGVLTEVAALPHELWPRIVSRVKLIAALKLNVTNRSQDGRFTIFLEKDKVDVRVSTIPTAYGESVVLRLLRSAATGLGFDDLGVRGKALEELERQVSRPNGMVITTGPTGSGKTTTLYSILSKLNSPKVKIITLEDPIEYKLEGVNQSQIDPAKDYTFAKGLRSILRQDPDVVMVGEIRDLETADTAIQAALTGHLVLSTIHTNSAAGAVPRFLSMGVKGFLLAPALNAVIGQRLVRKICPACKVEDKLDAALSKRVREILERLPPLSGYKIDAKKFKFWKGGGCAKCHGLGFQSRVGIYEILVMNKEIETIILSGNTSEYQMEEVGVKNGMVTMVQDGLLKAADGITTVAEVFRVAE